MAKSRHRRKLRSRSAPKRGVVAAGLELAGELIDEGRITEANALLAELEQRHPPNQQVLNDLAYTYQELGDAKSNLMCCRKLFNLTASPKHALILASAYQMNQRPVLAMRVYFHFLEKWPEDEEAEEVRAQTRFIEPHLYSMIAEGGFVGEEGLESASMHEEVQVLLGEGLLSKRLNWLRTKRRLFTIWRSPIACKVAVMNTGNLCRRFTCESQITFSAACKWPGFTSRARI